MDDIAPDSQSESVSNAPKKQPTKKSKKGGRPWYIELLDGLVGTVLDFFCLGRYWDWCKEKETKRMKAGVLAARIISLLFLAVTGTHYWDAWQSGEKPISVNVSETDTEARKQINNLQSLVVDPNEWQPLTDEQVNYWAEALHSLEIRDIRVFWPKNILALKLFRSLQLVGKKDNFSVGANEGGTPWGDGIQIIGTYKDDPISPILMKLFNQSGYPVSFIQPVSSPGFKGISIGEKPDGYVPGHPAPYVFKIPVGKGDDSSSLDYSFLKLVSNPKSVTATLDKYNIQIDPKSITAKGVSIKIDPSIKEDGDIIDCCVMP
jgi:hypothetical protein